MLVFDDVPYYLTNRTATQYSDSEKKSIIHRLEEIVKQFSVFERTHPDAFLENQIMIKLDERQ